MNFSLNQQQLQPGRWLGAASLLLVVVLFGWLLSDLVARGIGVISWEFLSTSPADAGRTGGIAPVLASSALILLICMAVCVPIGLASAILLAGIGSQKNGRFLAVCRQSLDVLAGVPSIVFGLFGNAFFCLYLGMGFSILAGGLTLACMVLPFFIRSCETALRAIADEHMAGGLALGMSYRTLLQKILLPTALPGLIAGFVLALARALAETAALLFTSGYVSRMPESIMDSGRAMSVHIYDLAMNVTGGEASAYGTAVVLMMALAVINISVTLLSRYWNYSRFKESNQEISQ